VQNRLGLWHQLTSLLFVGLLNCVAIFPDERNVFYRERADGTYTTAPFFLSYLLNELPAELIASLVFTVTLTFAIGLVASVEQCLVTAFVVFCVVNSGEALGIVFCALVYNPGLSVSLTNPFLSTFSLMAGVAAVNLNPILDGINHVSVLRYATRVYAQYELKDITFYCTPSQTFGGFCPFTSGTQVLDLYGFNDMPIGELVGIIVVLTVGYRVLGFIILSLNRHKFAA